MNRGKWARGFVALATVVAWLGVARPAAAQFLAPAVDRPGFDRRLTQPSLRLSMLGGVSLLFDDENNELNLWDFGGSSLGLLSDRDSTSFDFFFTSGSSATKHTVGTVDREIQRASGLNAGLQAVGRSPGKFALGVDAGYLVGETGIPAQTGIYQSRSSNTPVAIPVLNGTAFGGKWGYGIRFAFTNSSINNDLKTETEKDGEILLQDGDVVGSPPFDITEGKIHASGLGLGIGYTPSKTFNVALNFDELNNKVHGSNNNARRVYELDEPQNSGEWSLTAIARPSWVVIGAQIGRRSFDSSQEYRFSQSGGLNGPPLVSRGDRLLRDFRQDWLRSRVLLNPTSLPNLAVAGDLSIRYDRDQVDPATTPGNYNEFLVDLSIDTLQLGPAVTSTLDELRHWNAGLGASYRLTTRLQFGAEGHRYNTALDGPLVHSRQKLTDLKAGAEYVVSSTWTGRAGYSHRSADDDVYTLQNETVTNLATFGAGYARPGTQYSLDAGFEFGKRDSNYPDPTKTTGSLFRFMLYNRWAF
jgi:hypothetical protein